MAHINTGLRKILEHPIVYSIFQSLLRPFGTQERMINDFLELKDGQKVLDIGCGPANILSSINYDIDYTGIDFEEAYIESAKRKFGHRAKFIHANLSNYKFPFSTSFDRILLLSIQHHLDDSSVRNVLGNIAKLLDDEGMFFGIENVYIENQNPIAKKIISMDRGTNVRTIEGYKTLAAEFFNEVEVQVIHDLLRIPYTHIVIKGRRPKRTTTD